MAIGATLVLASAGVAAAVNPQAGPAGRGVCATQAAAMRTGATVDTLRAFANCEIARRDTTLNALATRITASKTLTSADAAALSSIVASTKAGLAGLKTVIAAETDIPALKADIAKIAADYRVYVLVVPQANLVTAADTVIAAQAKFTKVNDALVARIAAAKAAGKDTTAAQTALDAMNASVTQAVGLATPIPAALLPLTVAQFNSGTAGPILASARTSLGQAREKLRAATASAKACRDALK
jgi:hypothetical protein